MSELSFESLELIQRTAVEAAGSENKLTLVPAPQLGPGKCIVVKSDGSYDILEQSQSRQHSLGDLETVINWTQYAATTLKAKPVLWINSDRIQVVIDDLVTTAARPAILYQFKQTPEYELILRLAKGDPLLWDQKSWLRMLRTELWDCLDPTRRDQWIRIFRALSSTDNTDAKSSVSVGRQSLGREIDMQVSSEHGDIPEQFILSVRLFADPALAARQPIKADVDATATTFKFSLQPIKSDLVEALENELNDCIKLLRTRLGKDVPIFRGSPV